MNKISTVNVLEVIDKVPKQIISFLDTTKGNKEAEKVFTKIAKENGAEEADIESYLEDGLFEYDNNGGTGVYLIHSV